MFVKHSHDGKIVILIIYVDDIILTGYFEEERVSLKKIFAPNFEIKDLGNLRYFLGMEIARSQKGISVSQRKYILDLLQEMGMMGCKLTDTPMDSTMKIGLAESSIPIQKERYQRLVGKLIDLSHTSLDISFPVSVVSQFMNKKNEEHLTTIYRIHRYLKMTQGKGLFFRKNTVRDIEIDTDANWAGSTIDRWSTFGYCTYVWGNLVTWQSKKQSVVARSSAEVEFRGYGSWYLWLKRLLGELKIPIREPIKMLCDNQAVINIARNPVHHNRTKNVEIDRHFRRKK